MNKNEEYPSKKRAPIKWDSDPKIFEAVVAALYQFEEVLDIRKKALCIVSALDAKGIIIKNKCG